MDVQEELLSAEAFGVPSHIPIERIQTHISWVFLLEKDVYKVKRPVELGFLDFSSVEKRRVACEAEVELNRRLAPHAYLGVVPICRASTGRLQVGGPGQVIDWAVHMQRLCDEDRADTLLERGQLSPRLIDAIASRLAAFHAQAACDRDISSWGSPEHVAQNIRENFAQTRNTIDRLLPAAEADELERWQVDFVLKSAALLRQRVQQKRVRDGHGDLRLEHVYLEADNVTVLDCIEFNDRFRYADVCADIAFLSMDLGAHGRVDLAELLLARYARYANDYDLYGVVDFYESYRALVRAKIACFTAQDEMVDHPTRERAWSQARRYALVSLAYWWR